jgi:ribonuclease-3
MDDARAAKLAEFQNKIGYAFTDTELLNIALTHTSFVKGDGNNTAHNERLEFLGDSVLELCVSKYLYQNYPGVNEGVMTRARALAVYEPALFRAAQAFGVGEALQLSRGEEHSGGREKPSILSDALEAVIGAMFLDGGLDAAERFILRFALTPINEAMDGSTLSLKDYKTTLQEYAQRKHMGAISYVLTGESGPDHKKEFEMQVLIGATVCGTGRGNSKQDAGQRAAFAALRSFGEA